MDAQEFLQGVIEKICANKAEVESNYVKLCNEVITNGHAKHQELYHLDVLLYDFMIQVLCHMLHDRALLNKDMKKIITERDAFKMKVDALKTAKLKDEERNKACSWEAQIDHNEAVWKTELAEAMKANNELVKKNTALERQLTSKRAEPTQQKTLKWKNKSHCKAVDLQEFLAIEEQRKLCRRKQIMLQTRSRELTNLEALAATQQPVFQMKSQINNKKAYIMNIKKDISSLHEDVMRRMAALMLKAQSSTTQSNIALKRHQDAILELDLAKKKLCNVDAHSGNASGALTAATLPDNA